jgi:hypothetical protein
MLELGDEVMVEVKNNELNKILATLKIEKVPEIWHKAWASSLMTYPGEKIFFLQNDYLLWANSILNFPEEALKVLLCSAAVIRSSPGLCKLVWHCYNLLFQAQDRIEPLTFFIPPLKQSMGDDDGMFAVILLLSGLQRVLKIHEERGVCREITIDTLNDINLWMKNYFNKHGQWGTDQFPWLIYHFTGRLYKLGRLQFMIDTLKEGIKVLRNIDNKRVLVMSEPGIRYRNDGQVDGTNNIFDFEGAWIAQFEIEGDLFRGNIITPYGCAAKEIVELPADEWELVLSKDAPVLSVHIPKGGRMTHELCGESFNYARKFFSEHFPNWEFFAYICTTWFFDSQFQEILPNSSNIVRFQREFYLYPILSNDYQIFERVFGGKPGDFTKAPRDTHIRRAILDHVIAGRNLHGAGGFILRDDLNWGEVLYQKKWDIHMAQNSSCHKDC